MQMGKRSMREDCRGTDGSSEWHDKNMICYRSDDNITPPNSLMLSLSNSYALLAACCQDMPLTK